VARRRSGRYNEAREESRMETVVVVRGESMGTGDEALGRKLLGNFLRTLGDLDTKPDAIVFYNAGVKLLAEGTPLRAELAALEDAGVDLLGCGTCLDHFGLIEKLVVGEVSNMRAIAARLLAANVVSI
jgi:selenium metabolism protein YedF